MRVSGFVIAMVAGVLLFASAARADDPVIARLGTTTVKASELKPLIATLNPSDRAKAASDPKVLATLVRFELGRRAVLAEALKKRWDQQPQVAAAIQRARSEIIAATYLASVAKLPADFPSEDQLRQVYDANRDRFLHPKQYHLAQIYIALPPGATDSQKQAAQDRASSLAHEAQQPGADFAALARANSQDSQSAANGGDLGWLGMDSLLPAVAAQVQGMADGAVSGAIAGTDGWHIVHALGSRPAGTQSFEDVHDALASTLRKQAMTQAEDAYVRKLLEDKKAAIDEIALQKLSQSGGAP
jgi:peptidylprolyl isomerase